MEKDLHHNCKVVNALNLQAISSNTTTVGNIIDTALFESIEWAIIAGTITDGAYALKIEHGDDSGLSDAADIGSDDLLGTLTGLIATDDDGVKRVGYIGKKRYVRLSLVSTGVTTGVDSVGAVALLSDPKHAPVAEQ